MKMSPTSQWQEARAFNDLVQKLQQQFLQHRENINHKLERLEEIVELAVQKMQQLKQFEASSQENQGKTVYTKRNFHGPMQHLQAPYKTCVFEGLKDCEHQLDDFGIGNRTQEWPNTNSTEEENVEWKEEFPDIQKKREVFKDHADAACKTYLGEPIYDEEPGGDCWEEQEFILAALKGCNPNSPNPLQSENCTSESSEEVGEFSNTQQEKGIQNQWEDGEIDAQNVDVNIVRAMLIATPSRYIVLKQDRQGSLAKAIALAEHEASRKRVVITIFDPGGQKL